MRVKIRSKTYKQYLGDNVTNNQAEYRGMALALAYLVELITTSPTRSFGNITIHSDSQLVVEQINGKWKVRDADLKAACEECQGNLRILRERGYQVVLQWIPREKNSRADQLCNEVLKEAVCQLLITQHRLETVQGSRRPALVNKIGFHGINGALERNVDHMESAGNIQMPVFRTRSGELLPVSKELEWVLARLTAAVSCVGCKHCHLLEAEQNVAVESIPVVSL